MPQDRYPRRRRRVEERELLEIDLQSGKRLDRLDDVERLIYDGQLSNPKIEIVIVKQPVALVVGPALIDQFFPEARRNRRARQVI